MNNPRLLACVCAGMSITQGQVEWAMEENFKNYSEDFGLFAVQELLEATMEAIENEIGRQTVTQVFAEIKHENLNYHR